MGGRARGFLVVACGGLLLLLAGSLLLDREPPVALLELDARADRATASEAPAPDLGAMSAPATAGPRAVPARIEIAATEPRERPAPVATSDRIRQWVRDLRDDDVRGNAECAIRRLRQIGAAAIPELLPALDSDDAQQREFALRVLLDLQPPPTHRMLAGATGRLESGARYGYEPALAWLLDQGPAARGALLATFSGHDHRARLLSAYALARLGERAYADRVANLLVEHLRDNEFASDAMLAAQGLYHLGPPAAATLRAAWTSLDAQGRLLATRVLAHLETPTGTPPKRLPPIQQVSRVWRDPVLDFDYRRAASIR
jgi:hypothetical protein